MKNSKYALSQKECKHRRQKSEARSQEVDWANNPLLTVRTHPHCIQNSEFWVFILTPVF